MSDLSKAVFLSYASQDAEAARRICESLRAGGVEVWFDADGGLEHGDEWDAKIRRQVKECVLFIPVISSNTQARHEGYFRIEWELAAQRAMGIASGVPFILPVVIDDTREPDALVPDRFRMVQWTKLRGGEVPPDVQQRFLKLWSHRTGVLKHEAAGATTTSSPAVLSAAETIGKPGSKVYALIATAIAVIVVGVGWWLLSGRGKPAAIESSPKTAAAAPLSETQKLLAQINTIWAKQGDATHDELLLAEDLGARVVAKEPTNADGWAAYAQATLALVYFDSDGSRQAPALSRAQRAVSLAGEAFEPRFALANVYRARSTTREEGLRLLQKLVQERPDDRRVWRELASALSAEGKYDEALAAIDRAIALPGGDPYAWNIRSGILMNAGRTEEAMTALEHSLALHVGPRALMGKGYIQVFVRDDFDAAAATIDQIPGSFLIREIETWAYGAFWLNYRQPEKCLARFRAFDGDFVFGKPKGYYVGRALEMTGRAEAAQLEWRAALRLVETKLGAQPNDPELLTWKTLLLACLGEKDAAERMLPLVRQLDLSDGELPVPVILARLGRNEEAIAELDARWRQFDRGLARYSRAAVLHDAFFDPLRGNPRFQAFVEKIRNDPRFPIPDKKSALSATDSSAVPAPGNKSAPAAKSVAVLAFANLSDDKGNEYFSDGISEELLNVLAKIPNLKVSARTSAFYFKGKEVPIPEIAKQLGVAYVVEGSVRKAGDKVRITAQLIKASDGFHVWSETFTRDLKDIFAVQDEIAGLIARNLELKIAGVAQVAAIDPEAYRLFLEARHLAQRENIEGWNQSIILYRRAIERDSGYAAAWAELAQVYQRLARFGGLPALEGMREARTAAQRALELDPKQVVGLDALGWVQRTADWDWMEAKKSFQRALQLAPENPVVMVDAAVLYVNIGRVDEGIALARRAVERDPLSATVQFYLGVLLEASGRFEESLQPLTRAIELAPAADEFRTHLARALACAGRLSEAEAIAKQEPNEGYRVAIQSFICFRRGDLVGGTKLRNELIANYSATLTGYIAISYADTGDRDEAFVWLNRAYDIRDAAIAWSKTGVVLQNLHVDPRWPVFLRKIGLADDQLK